MGNHINTSIITSDKKILTASKMKAILNNVDDNALIIFENEQSRKVVKDLFIEKRFYSDGTDSVRVVLLNYFLNGKVIENDWD